MRICAISDTHAGSLRELPERALGLLSKSDLIVHAGDYTSPSVVEELRAIGDFKGVYGNMDAAEIKRTLPSALTFEVKGIRFGVTHPPEGGTPLGLEKKAMAKFDNVDVVIFGHNHKAQKKTIDDLQLINPGSASGTFPALRSTMCTIDLQETLRAEIIYL